MHLGQYNMGGYSRISSCPSMYPFPSISSISPHSHKNKSYQIHSSLMSSHNSDEIKGAYLVKIHNSHYNLFTHTWNKTSKASSTISAIPSNSSLPRTSTGRPRLKGKLSFWRLGRSRLELIRSRRTLERRISTLHKQDPTW